MPPQVCRDIASKLVELTALEAGDLLLDVGAGTGEIGSEIVHLRERYVVQEAFRVAQSPSAILVVGRVRRDSRSVKARMRREMLRLLGATRSEFSNVESQSQALIDALVKGEE